MVKCDICKRKYENNEVSALQDIMICDNCWEMAMGPAKNKGKHTMSSKDILVLLKASPEERKMIQMSYIQEEQQKEDEAKRLRAEQSAANTVKRSFFGQPGYSIDGARGRHLDVFEHFVVIKTSVTIGSVITGNVVDGEKVLFYEDCIGIHFKEPRATIGFLQLETASMQMNNQKSNFFNENTFTFEDITDEVLDAYQYIFEKVRATKGK